MHGRPDARTHGQNYFTIIPFFLSQVQRCCLWLHPVTVPCMWNTTYAPLWNICIPALNTRKLQYNENKKASYLQLQFQFHGGSEPARYSGFCGDIRPCLNKVDVISMSMSINSVAVTTTDF